MARFTLGVLAGVIISAVAGAAFGIKAQEDDVAEVDETAPPLPAETVVTAIRAGIDARLLQGAVNTTRAVSAVAYLQAEGVIPSVPVPQLDIPAAPSEPPWGVWDRLSICESTSNWRANTGNGYFGGTQMDMTFWRRYGGPEFAPRPDLATRAQQIVIAERGLAVQGPGAWPICSRVAGLTWAHARR